MRNISYDAIIYSTLWVFRIHSEEEMITKSAWFSFFVKRKHSKEEEEEKNATQRAYIFVNVPTVYSVYRNHTLSFIHFRLLFIHHINCNAYA